MSLGPGIILILTAVRGEVKTFMPDQTNDPDPRYIYMCATCGNKMLATNFEVKAEEGTLCPECSCIYPVEPDED